MYSLFQEIDEAINRAKEKGYSKVVEFGAKGLNYAAKAVLSGALLGQDFLADRLGKRSSSMFELNRGPIVRRQKLRTTEVFDYDDPDFVSHLRAQKSLAACLRVNHGIKQVDRFTSWQQRRQ
ncbi:unnamed protein product [Schistosoma curassoni]|uniref:Transposase n=1 Tax=Schistosoma curassoni TaxID=6186 RepID=A0A183KDG0_9TREM|nr:unnamed protein product [Schistosoma curassoni]